MLVFRCLDHLYASISTLYKDMNACELTEKVESPFGTIGAYKIGAKCAYEMDNGKHQATNAKKFYSFIV